MDKVYTYLPIYTTFLGPKLEFLISTITTNKEQKQNNTYTFYALKYSLTSWSHTKHQFE